MGNLAQANVCKLKYLYTVPIMSNAVFGTVNATGLNISGILQATQIITTQPMQVSNLTATGNLTVRGNISGNVITAASVANSTGLIPYGQYNPDSQDVFYSTNQDTISFPPVHLEHEYDNDINKIVFYSYGNVLKSVITINSKDFKKYIVKLETSAAKLLYTR